MNRKASLKTMVTVAVVCAACGAIVRAEELVLDKVKHFDEWTYNYNPGTDTHTMRAGGEIWGVSWDEELFANEPVTGDYSVRANCQPLDWGAPWTTIGVTHRRFVDPESPKVGAFITGLGRQVVTVRPDWGENEALFPTEEGQALTSPWIRMDRTGDEFRFYFSNNGSDWEEHYASPQVFPTLEGGYVGFSAKSGCPDTMVQAEVTDATISGSPATDLIPVVLGEETFGEVFPSGGNYGLDHQGRGPGELQIGGVLAYTDSGWDGNWSFQATKVHEWTPPPNPFPMSGVGVFSQADLWAEALIVAHLPNGQVVWIDKTSGAFNVFSAFGVGLPATLGIDKEGDTYIGWYQWGQNPKQYLDPPVVWSTPIGAGGVWSTSNNNDFPSLAVLNDVQRTATEPSLEIVPPVSGGDWAVNITGPPGALVELWTVNLDGDRLEWLGEGTTDDEGNLTIELAKPLETCAFLQAFIGDTGPQSQTEFVGGDSGELTGVDVGNPGQPGSTTHCPTLPGYIVVGDGADIWGTSDQFHFGYKELTGPAGVQARVNFVDPGANDWSKAGMMIRSSTAADSSYAFLCVRNPDEAAPQQPFQARLTDGAQAVTVQDNSLPFMMGPDILLRITRNDSLIQAFADPENDGTFEFAGETVIPDLPDPALFGLAVTSHTNGGLVTAIFSEVVWLENPPIVGKPVTPCGPLDDPVVSGFIVKTFEGGEAIDSMDKAIQVKESTDPLAEAVVPVINFRNTGLHDGLVSPSDPVPGLVPEATFVPGGGVLGGALGFQGVGDFVENMDAGVSLNGLTALSISMWIKSNQVGTDAGFFNLEYPSGNDDRGIRYDDLGSLGGGDDVIKIGMTTTGGLEQYESAENVQTTDWQHVVWTWQSGVGIQLYIDGEADTPTYKDPPVAGTLTGNTNLIVGRGAKDWYEISWDGLMDDAAFWKRLLTDAEIDQIWNGGAGQQADQISTFGLQTYWKFDEDGGDTAYDSSGNGFHGAPNQNYDNYVVEATGWLKVDVPGVYTLGAHTDDGFRVEICDQVVGEHPDPRVPGLTPFSVDFIEAGFYKLNFLGYEYGGGSEFELLQLVGGQWLLLNSPGTLRVYTDAPVQPPQPEIEVQPGEVQIAVELGGTQEAILTISNVGDEGSELHVNKVEVEAWGISGPDYIPLEWNIEWEGPPVTLKHGETTEVKLIVDATACSELGPVNAYKVNIGSNDPDTPWVILPVDITVTEPAPTVVLTVNPTEINITGQVGETGEVEVEIGNAGDQELDWAAELADGPSLVVPPPAPGTAIEAPQALNVGTTDGVDDPATVEWAHSDSVDLTYVMNPGSKAGDLSVRHDLTNAYMRITHDGVPSDPTAQMNFWVGIGNNGGSPYDWYLLIDWRTDDMDVDTDIPGLVAAAGQCPTTGGTIIELEFPLSGVGWTFDQPGGIALIGGPVGYLDLNVELPNPTDVIDVIPPNPTGPGMPVVLTEDPDWIMLGGYTQGTLGPGEVANTTFDIDTTGLWVGLHSTELLIFSNDLINPLVGLVGVLVNLDVQPEEPSEVEFKRGDANADGGVDFADAMYILENLFGQGPASLCPDAADADDDGNINIADAMAIMDFLYGGSGSLPPPGADECGPDPTDDSLPPGVYPSCHTPPPVEDEKGDLKVVVGKYAATASFIPESDGEFRFVWHEEGVPPPDNTTEWRSAAAGEEIRELIAPLVPGKFYYLKVQVKDAGQERTVDLTSFRAMTDDVVLAAPSKGSIHLGGTQSWMFAKLDQSVADDTFILELSIDGGQTQQAVNWVDMSDGVWWDMFNGLSVRWDVPLGVNSDDCLLYVIDATDPTIFGVSALFTIVDGTVPDVTGMSEAEAKAELAAHGFVAQHFGDFVDDTVAPGTIVSQSPAAGTPALPGDVVNLGVGWDSATGIPTVSIEDLIRGMDDVEITVEIIDDGGGACRVWFRIREEQEDHQPTWAPLDVPLTTGQQIEHNVDGLKAGTPYNIEVRAENSAGAGPPDDYSFLTLPARLELKSPNGGVTYKPGDRVLVTWKADGEADGLTLVEYSTDNGRTWKTIGNTSTSKDAWKDAHGGYMPWKIPENITPSDECLVRVTCMVLIGVSDQSDKPFSIVAGE